MATALQQLPRLSDAEFHRRVDLALDWIELNSELQQRVEAEVDAFFAQHDRRTKFNEAYVTMLVIERLSQLSPEPIPARESAKSNKP